MSALTTRDALAKALFAHQPTGERTNGSNDTCSCGWVIYEGRSFIAHQAAALPVIDAATLVTPLFTAVVKATIDDPTGHLPNCGYTHENQTCGCAEYGKRLHSAIAAALTERAS